MKPRWCRARGLQALLTLLLLFSTGNQAASALDPNKSVTQYALRSWTADQGLPQGWISALLQTHDGFLWIGTKGGLARFDGIHFNVFKSYEADSIPNDTITSLAEDTAGNLWIGSPGGLTRYRDGHFTTYTQRDGLPETSVWRLCADHAGGIWIVTSYSRLVRFDGSRFKSFDSTIGGLFGEVNSILEDRSGVLWMATFHGLLRFEHGALTRRHSRADGLLGDMVYALCLDRKGVLWLAGATGVYFLDNQRIVHRNVAGLSQATFLSVDRDGNLWTGATGAGLFRVNGRGVSRLKAAQGLVSDEIYTILEDRDGGVWIGTVSGLNQLQDSIFTSFGAPEGLRANTQRLVAVEESDHAIWMGGDHISIRLSQGAVSKLNESRQPVIFPYAVHSNSLSRQGLIARFGAKDFSILRPTGRSAIGRLGFGGIGNLFYDRDGVLWAGTGENGLIRFEPNGKLKAYTTRDGLTDNNVRVINQDLRGNLWVGTISGLSRIHNGAASRVATCEVVTSIWVDDDGSVWAGSESGLLHYRDGSIRTFTQKDGLPTNVIQGVAGDNFGQLWLGTLQGVVRVAKQSLLEIERGGREPLSPIVFGKSDGLRDSEIRQDSVFRSQDGRIWFLTMKEIATVDPKLIPPSPSLAAYIENPTLDDKPLPPDLPFIVPPGRHRIEIQYTAPNLSSPGRTNFRYMLEGWDREWVNAGIKRSVSYTGIPVGPYRFRVTVSNGWNSANLSEATLPIVVRPYFYETGWFFAICLAAVAGMAIAVHNLRVAQMAAHLNDRLQERLEERSRIARELHDTLLQGVIGMLMQLYAIETQLTENSSVKTALARVVGRAHNLVDDGRIALEDLRSQVTHNGALEEALLTSIEEFDIPENIQVHVTTAGISRPLNYVVQGDVYRIAREALTNAVKHSHATAIAIEVGYSDAALKLRIWDNGQGFLTDPDVIGRSGHWGIRGMRERAEHIGGQLRIWSRPAGGAEVELRIPARLAYRSDQRRPQFQVISSWLRRQRSNILKICGIAPETED